MIVHDKIIVIYDIEVFPNIFHCTCKNTETKKLILFEISERKNQLQELINYFKNKNYLFCGYNNHHYDDVILNYIIDYEKIMSDLDYNIIDKSIFTLSNLIVTSDEQEIKDKIKKWKYINFFESMDLLTMMFSSKLRIGLKEMQMTMHYKNTLEFSGNFNENLDMHNIEEMIQYNINDVESTYTLFENLKNKGEIGLRLFIEKEYKINALSMDSVKFGETILAKKICEQMQIDKKQLDIMRSPMDYIPLKDVILSYISYKNPVLRAILEDMKKQIIFSKERKSYEKKFVLSNTVFSVGVGGIHSINEPKIFRPKKDEYIGHLDVASMYPSFIVNYGWFPRHLGKYGLDVYINIYNERIQAKHNRQTLKNLALKLTLNSVTGKMQQETSWMYDPFNVFKIRINGQLILLMLVDILLEYNCKIIQVNTDGVMFIAKEKNRKDIMESVSNLETLTKLNFEADDYEEFYQLDVNNYFGVCKGFTECKNEKLIEKKGWFITETLLGKGLSPTIIPISVINFFIYNIPIEQTIKNCKDIKKFLIGQKVDKKFKVIYGNKFIQRINRYFVSTNGYYLNKYDKENNKEITMLKNFGVTILNKLTEEPIENRKINYAYYIKEARKIINQLKCRQLDLFEQI